MKTTTTFFISNLKRFWQFLNDDAFIAPILDELRSNSKGQTVAVEYRKLASDGRTLEQARLLFQKQASYEERAALIFHLLLRTCEESNASHVVSTLFGSAPEHTVNYVGFKNEVLAPFCDYIHERLEEQEAILGLLVRYKKRCEWFNRAELAKIAEDEEARKGVEKKQAEVESVLKADLYRYLHDQGCDFTIEPYSHQGRIDLILDQKEGSRKYLEGKVFDNNNRDVNYIIKGFGQLLHYLGQYNASNGYLLVYKTCEEQLVIEGADQLGQIPLVRCEGKAVFIMVVDLCQYRESVSKRTYEPIRISVDQLCKTKVRHEMM